MSVHGRELRSSAPYLTSLAVTSTSANGVSYEAGERISITATFSAPVTGELALAIRYSDSNVIDTNNVNKTGGPLSSLTTWCSRQTWTTTALHSRQTR